VCVMNPSMPYCVSKIFTWIVSLSTDISQFPEPFIE
jgi:hypothetical protein